MFSERKLIIDEFFDAVWALDIAHLGVLGEHYDIYGQYREFTTWSFR